MGEKQAHCNVCPMFSVVYNVVWVCSIFSYSRHAVRSMLLLLNIHTTWNKDGRLTSEPSLSDAQVCSIRYCNEDIYTQTIMYS